MDALTTRSVTQTPSRWRTHSVTSLTHSRSWPRGVFVCDCGLCLHKSLNQITNILHGVCHSCAVEACANSFGAVKTIIDSITVGT